MQQAVAKKPSISDAEMDAELANVRRGRGKPAFVVEKSLKDKIKQTFERLEGYNERLRDARAEKDISQDELSQRLKRLAEYQGLDDLRGCTRSNIAQWETGNTHPSRELTILAAQLLDVTPEYLDYGVTTKPRTVLPDPEELGYVLTPEITIDADAKETATQQWGIPVNWLKQELGITSFKDLMIYKVMVNGDPFEYGDRVIIDRSDQRPTPPGHFLYWDAVGAMIAHMLVVPGGKKPMIKVTGLNGDFEAELSKLTIIGRVRGVWRKA